MSSQPNPVLAMPRVVIAEPDETPYVVGTELGGVLEFRNHFHEFPDFEIVFDAPGPPCASDKLTGSIHDPIFVHMPDWDAVFSYHIIYKKKDGTCRRDGKHLFARSCPGCQQLP